MRRREVLGWMGGALAGALLGDLEGWGQKGKRKRHGAHAVAAKGLSAEDEAFLDDMQRRGCLYFMEQADPSSGQVLDRAKAASVDGDMDPRRLSSIAATGFGLTALCIAHKRGYLPAEAVESRVARTVAFHAHHLKQEHGFFCHFNDVRSGQPYPHVEYSSIDTSLLLCGVLTARAYFAENAAIVRDATLIYERVDWPWMIFESTGLFCMGWKPDSGFLHSVWNHYCELMMIPLLAMGSPTHAASPAVWTAWSRPEMVYRQYRYIGADDPLFVHQYSHAWFDFRGRRDAFANYFENSVTATEAHRQFCLDWGTPYSPGYWGISASDSEHGYHAWGGPPAFGGVDGTVVPCAAAGSLPFVPAPCLETLRALKATYGERAWGRYGFCDAFHPAAAWYDDDVLGIDLGIGVVMAENLRTGFIWEVFGRNPEVPRAMQLAGFHPVLHA